MALPYDISLLLLTTIGIPNPNDGYDTTYETYGVVKSIKKPEVEKIRLSK